MLDKFIISCTRKLIGSSDKKRKKTQKPLDGVDVARDIMTENEPVFYDVYRDRARQGALPVIIDIHGGGWVYGDKALNDVYITHLARRGYAVVSPEYRLLADGADLKAQIKDLSDCMADAYKRREELGLDFSRAYLAGDSAGGHLATLLWSIAHSERLQALYGVQAPPFSVRAIGLSHPVPDPAAKLGGVMGANLRMLQKHFSKDPEILQNMSICRFAKEIPLPKIFLISCGKDALSPLSVDFAHWLEENGAEYVFKFYDKEDHPKLSHVFDVAFPHYEESQQAISEMLDFFEKA